MFYQGYTFSTVIDDGWKKDTLHHKLRLIVLRITAFKLQKKTHHLPGTKRSAPSVEFWLTGTCTSQSMSISLDPLNKSD